ncbi:hypothetical protein BSKO_00697 [Bryopsis sp. KO-2023]|nr:hypothetical protein BSKO_00697 [Bryopsis sp. KO-2023]
MEPEAELPKIHVKRIVKSKLSELLDGGDDNKKSLALNKDALLAFSESARVFIWYVTSTANDICREAKRQTVGADDVLRALDDLDFGDFVPQLREVLEDFKKDAKEKSRKKQEQLKKRKVDRDEDQADKGEAPESEQKKKKLSEGGEGSAPQEADPATGAEEEEEGGEDEQMDAEET